MARPPIVLLGPQRKSPSLGDAVKSLGLTGPLAVVTAGWEEREPEDEELDRHLGGRTLNLRIYQRADEVFERDTELFAAMRDRHDRLRALQNLYRLRLSHVLKAARDLFARDDDPELLEPEIAAAIETVRDLDAHHLARVVDVHAEFNQRLDPKNRPAVVRQRAEIVRDLRGVSGLCIAGGHVAILLNRMRLFSLDEIRGKLPIFAWSAGAMALSERIVLFHDSPPQGPGNAEVLEQGLGLCPGVVPLPQATKRLRLDDPARVALFARRFAPARCITLEKGTRLDWNGKSWKMHREVRELALAGTVGQSAV